MWEFIDGIGNAFYRTFWDIINFNTHRRENELIREREDTAVQRRAADLEAAGMSKTLAAGSAATTSVTSAPQYQGNGIMDALMAAQATAQIRNAREENANMRKSREVMDSDIGLKYGQMMKEFAQADYFNKAGENQSQDVLLKQEQIKLFAQQILESIERTKGYEYSAKNQSAQSELNFWKAVNEKLDSALIMQSGLRSSTGGVAPSIIKGVFQGFNNAFELFGGRRPIADNWYNEMSRGFKWKK